jgi:hypothetical protein
VGGARPSSTAARMAESTAILFIPGCGSDIINRHSANGYFPVDFSIGRIIAHPMERSVTTKSRNKNPENPVFHDIQEIFLSRNGEILLVE